MSIKLLDTIYKLTDNSDKLDGKDSSYFHRNHLTSISDLTGEIKSDVVTFDYNSPSNGPEGWINGFVSVHSNYLSSFIVNEHRTDNWNVGWYDRVNGSGSITWRKLIHSGNIGSQSVSYASSAGSVAWGNVSGKPSSFTPSSHTHTKSQITDFAHTHDYAATSHTHTKAQITDFSHTHNYAGSSSAGGAATSANKLNCISNTISTKTDDTVAKWGPIGSSIHFYSVTGQLNDQPSQYGMIFNVTTGGTEVHQIWMTQSSGNMAHRGGNAAGWAGTWRTLLDTSNYSTWVAAKSHTHDYAASSHNHDSVYSKLDHTHSYAASNHNHDSVYSKLGHTHDYAASNHTHSYAAASHTHGTYHSDFTVTLSNTTTDSGWSMINSSYNSGFLLKSIRTQASAPGWIEGNYAAGICFGGADTKGVLSCAYNAPYIKIAGGNGTKPVWWIRISGTSGNTYNLSNFSTTSHNHDSVYSKLGHTHDYAASSHSHTSYFYDKGNKNSGWDTCIDNGAFYTSNVTPVSGAYGYGTFLAFRSYPTCVQFYFPDWSAMPYFRCGWNAQSSMSSYGWVGLITTSNIGSQSVNYANSAGNANTVDGYHISVGSSAGSDANTIYYIV